MLRRPGQWPEHVTLYERFKGFGEEQNPEDGGHGELEACAVDELRVVSEQQGQNVVMKCRAET